MAKEENEKEKNKPKPCPKWLNDTAKKEWRRVAKILAEEGKDFTDKDLKALEAYCINYAREKDEVQATNVARYDLDVVEVQNSIIADLAEVNRLLLEELENYRSMEDEDKQLLMMIEDIKEGREDLERMLEP